MPYLNSNIPHPNEIVNHKENKQSRQWKHLCRIDQRFLAYLSWQYHNRRKRNELQPDGSFFGTNEFYQGVFGISRRTLMRSKKRLQEAGLIRCSTHQGRGKATYYFILDTTPKPLKSEPQKEQERPPLNTEEVKRFAKEHSREIAFNWFLRSGYTPEEINAALD